MKIFETKKFKIKIFLLLTITFIVPIIVFSILNYFDEKNYDNIIFQEFIDKDFENQKEIFEYWIKKKKEEMNNFSSMLELYIKRESKSKKIDDILEQMIEIDGDIINSYFTTKNGENYLNGINNPVVDGREREWYKGALDKEISVIEPYEDAVTGEMVITFSKTILKEDGELIGVLGIDVLFSKIVDKFFKSIDNSNIRLVIINSDDKILFSSRDVLNKDIEKILENKFLGINYNKRFAVKNINSIGVRGILIFNKTNYLLNSRFYNNENFIVFMIFLLIVIFIIIWIVSNVLYSPVGKLEKYTFDLIKNSKGEIESLEFQDLDEILKLFLEMNEFINKNIDSIQIMKIDLEDRNQTLVRLNEEYEKAYFELEKFSDELSQKERAYENLVENIMDYIWIVDSFGIISYMNEKFLDALGYKEFEVLGKNFSEISSEFKYNDELYKMLNNRDYDSLDMKFMSKNGEKEILTSTKTKRIYSKIGINSIQGISRDVTSERKMYKELISKNKDLLLINKISKEMTHTENLKNILNLILKEVDNLVGVKISSVRLLKNNRLSIKAYNGNKNDLIFSFDSLEIFDSHLGYSLRKNKVLIINSIDDIIIQDDKKIIEAVKNGNNFIILPIISDDKAIGVFSIITKNLIDSRIESVFSALANNISISIEKALLYEKLQGNYLKTIKALVTAMEAKNPFMQGHSNRVSLLSKLIAKKLYLNESEIKDIHLSALLHDIGKIGIKDDIMKNFDKNDKEREEGIRIHIEIGKKILEPIKLKKWIRDGVYYHHKGYDGTGYPDDNVETPLSALVIGIADDFDEMFNKKKNDINALEDIKESLFEKAGKKHSSEMVNIIVELINSRDEEFLSILNLY